ncbi:MAG: DUF523 domain-containing protein [Gammaproteobacteria bacterium]|nr:DUF523 domain-containing protein [Gammaproteobacteria bacterium]MBT4491699.1 DUF523 domain-containing protein [Gammaproteobacteria bacterium]MBT7370876.1 DUF523 domain-containing protein [Gammaproteobacteria bacterium]
MKVDARPKLGISGCLLGQKVRYDGGHKLNRYVTETLAEFFDLVSFCPEQAIGLPTPRNPIRLIAGPFGADVRAVEIEDPAKDYSERLDRFGREFVGRIGDFSGCIVKKNSPSCGKDGVKVLERGNPSRRGSGLFTARLLADRPELPVEEEGTLADPLLRENFIGRVYVMCRWQELSARALTKKKLLDFHARHRSLIPNDEEEINLELSRLLSGLESIELASVAPNYIRLLMHGLRGTVFKSEMVPE